MNDKKITDSLKKRARLVKLFATDLDGTLFDSKHELTPETRDALSALTDKGIKIVLATGRSRATIPDSIAEMRGVNYLMTTNGARIHVMPSDEIIYEKFLSAEALEYIFPYFDDPEVMCAVFWDGAPYVEEKRYYAARDYGVPRWYSDYFFESRRPLKNFVDAVNANADRIENINFYFPDEIVQQQVFLKLQTRTDLYELSSSFPFNFELNGLGVTKGAALDLIAKREGLKPKEIIAFGDNDNDASMIEYAGIGVAVANATPLSLAAADLVTELDNNNSGVAAALRLLELI